MGCGRWARNQLRFCVEIRPPASFDLLDAALRKLDGYDWLILTSANAVRALAERAAALGIVLVQPASLKVAAIGEGTGGGARAGLHITFVPVTYVHESLIQGLLEGDGFGQPGSNPACSLQQLHGM